MIGSRTTWSTRTLAASSVFSAVINRRVAAAHRHTDTRLKLYASRYDAADVTNASHCPLVRACVRACVCVCVCLCVCPRSYLRSSELHVRSSPFLYVLPMAVARSSSGGVVMLCTSGFMNDVVSQGCLTSPPS